MNDILIEINIVLKTKEILDDIMNISKVITDDLLINLLNEENINQTLKNIKHIINYSIDHPNILSTLITRDKNKKYILSSVNTLSLFHLLISNELILIKIDKTNPDIKSIQKGWTMAINLIEQLYIQNKFIQLDNTLTIPDNLGYFPLRYYESTAISKGNLILNSIVTIPYWYINTSNIYQQPDYIQIRTDIEKKIFELVINIIKQLTINNNELIDLVTKPTQYIWRVGNDDASSYLLGFLVRTGYENYALQIINLLKINIIKLPYYKNFIQMVAKSLYTTEYQNASESLLDKILNSSLDDDDKNIILKILEIGTPIELNNEIIRLKTNYKFPTDFRISNLDKFNNQKNLDAYDFKACENILERAKISLLGEFTDMWRANEKKPEQMFLERLQFMDYNTLNKLLRKLGKSIIMSKDQYNELQNKFINFSVV